MSHIVEIRTECRDPAAVAAACRRLGLPEPVQGTARLFEGEAAGLLVRLPGWLYPAVVEPATGHVRYDNYGGALGRPGRAGPVPPGLRRREGHGRGPPPGPRRRRAGPARRLDPADHRRGRWRMRTVEITVDPQGKSRVETQGLHRPRLPRGRPALRGGPGRDHGRATHRRLPPGGGAGPRLTQSS